MTYNLTVSPDFKPDLISGWFIFNTWLQKQLSQSVHLELYQSFAEQDKALQDKKVDLIYANPYDISRLVRDEGFVPVAKPKAKPDEAVVATRADGSIDCLEDVPANLRIAQTNAPDVNTIGMILLEPADLLMDDIDIKQYANYTTVAKSLINDDADVGFFLAEAFNEFSGLVKKKLKPIISSNIYLIHHALLVGPELLNYEADLRGILCDMHLDDKGKKILADLEISQFEPMDTEEAEFMIDLMDTLVTK